MNKLAKLFLVLLVMLLSTTLLYAGGAQEQAAEPQAEGEMIEELPYGLKAGKLYQGV